MKIAHVIEFVRLESESLSDIETVLIGSVFHVTKRENLAAIEASGALLPNSDNSFLTTFGSSENSFFRNRGCISVFDYRAPSAGTWERRTDCYPFQPASPGNEGVAIFVLNRVIYGRLQPWTLWGEEKAYNEKIAPYFEAGHEGPISLSLVDRLILLKIMEDPLSLAAMVRKSFNPLRE